MRKPQVRDAFAADYLSLAETADPMLRTAEQVRWFRELTAEQDNMHAALRWTISRGDASSALRFVRSLAYYWTQRGRGEGDALAREVLALEAPADSLLIAEARVVCAMMAAGQSWDHRRDPRAADRRARRPRRGGRPMAPRFTRSPRWPSRCWPCSAATATARSP